MYSESKIVIPDIYKLTALNINTTVNGKLFIDRFDWELQMAAKTSSNAKKILVAITARINPKLNMNAHTRKPNSIFSSALEEK